MQKREDNRRRAELATRFMNLKSKASVRDFFREHLKRNDIRVFPCGSDNPKVITEHAVTVLVDLTYNLSPLWTHEDHGGLYDPETALRHILFSVRAAALGGKIVYVDKTTPAKKDDWASPAVDIVPIKRGSAEFHFVYRRRDVLDDIAYAILVAARRGLLKECEGHKRGWRCPQRWLVADEKRRRFCYLECGKY